MSPVGTVSGHFRPHARRITRALTEAAPHSDAAARNLRLTDVDDGGTPSSAIVAVEVVVVVCAPVVTVVVVVVVGMVAEELGCKRRFGMLGSYCRRPRRWPGCRLLRSISTSTAQQNGASYCTRARASEHASALAGRADLFELATWLASEVLPKITTAVPCWRP
jgi:hypothetical protein